MSTSVITRGSAMRGLIGPFALAGCLGGDCSCHLSRRYAPEVITKNAAQQAAVHDKDEHEHAEPCDQGRRGVSITRGRAFRRTSHFPIPGIIHFNFKFDRSQQNHAFSLQSLRGAPVVIAMFYGTCRSVCPVLVEDLKRLEEHTCTVQAKTT